MRNNPRVTLDDARGGPALRARRSNAVMAQAQQSTRVAYRDEELESVQVQGVTEEYLDFTTFDAERGRMISPVEIRAQAACRAARLADRRPPVRRRRSARQADPHRRRAASAWSASATKKGSAFGKSLDEFVVIPLGAYQKLFGARQSLQLMVQPRDPSLVQQAKDEARVALRVERA